MSADIATVRINRPANEVFAFMADPYKLDLWSFGAWHTTVAPDGLIEGKALHDGRSVYVRITPHQDQQLIDYQVGSSSENIKPRIFARVVDGEDIGADSNQCQLLLIAIRSDEMDDERWQSLIDIHAVEVGLIKSLIESGYDHRQQT